MEVEQNAVARCAPNVSGGSAIQLDKLGYPSGQDRNAGLPELVMLRICEG